MFSKRNLLTELNNATGISCDFFAKISWLSWTGNNCSVLNQTTIGVMSAMHCCRTSWQHRHFFVEVNQLPLPLPPRTTVRTERGVSCVRLRPLRVFSQCLSRHARCYWRCQWMWVEAGRLSVVKPVYLIPFHNRYLLVFIFGLQQLVGLFTFSLNRNSLYWKFEMTGFSIVVFVDPVIMLSMLNFCKLSF